MKILKHGILNLKSFIEIRGLYIEILLILIIMVINAVISYFLKPLLLLSENQILYLMSTMAQAIAGLFGLVLAAYAIIDPKLKEVGSKDDQSADSIEKLRHKYFNNIIVLSIMCGMTIISCLFTLSTYAELSNKIIPILLNQSTLLSVGSIILFLYFGCTLLNPNALSNLSKEELKSINKEYGDEDKDFKPFVAYYNRLEALIIGYATELMNQELKLTKSYQYMSNGKKQIHIIQALEILNMKEIINRDILIKIDELRRYRNALVHSLDEQKVNPAIFEELKTIYEKLYEIYQSKDDNELWRETIRNLYNYAEKIKLSELDRKILDTIERDPNITVVKIANNLEISRTLASRKLKMLLNNQFIEEGKDGYIVLKNK